MIMEGNSIIGMAGSFIALSIFLGIGTLILGGSVTDCSQLAGFDSTNEPPVHTGWAEQCVTNSEQSQSGYGLLMVSLIVLAAAVVLIVVRLLSG